VGIHTTHMPACCLSPPSPNTHNCLRPPSSDTQHAGVFTKPHSAAVPGLCTVLQDCCPLPSHTPSTLLSHKKKATVTCPLNTPQLLALSSSCCLSAEIFTGNLKRWNMNYVYYVSKTVLECNCRITAGPS